MKLQRHWIVLVTATSLFFACGPPPEPVTMTFFYLPACPSCPETARVEAMVADLLRVTRNDDAMTVSNQDLRSTEAAQRFEAMATERDLNVRTLPLPVLFVNDHVYKGVDSVREYIESYRQ